MDLIRSTFVSGDVSSISLDDDSGIKLVSGEEFSYVSDLFQHTRLNFCLMTFVLTSLYMTFVFNLSHDIVLSVKKVYGSS